MTKKSYIVSTMTAAVAYPRHINGGGDMPLAVDHVVIQGGANVPDKYMRTPEGGVVTPVTEEEMAVLQESPVFQLHQKNGFIKILDKEPRSAEVAASDMEGRDKSAPMVDQDFEAEGVQPPVNSKNSRKA